MDANTVRDMLEKIAIDAAESFFDYDAQEDDLEGADHQSLRRRGMGIRVSQWAYWDGNAMLEIMVEGLANSNLALESLLVERLRQVQNPDERRALLKKMLKLADNPDAQVKMPKSAEAEPEQGTFEDIGVESLPLFSGTPIGRGHDSEAPSVTDNSQQIGFARCRACIDTGRIGDKFCFCPAGDQAKALAANRSVSQASRQNSRVTALEF